MRYKRISKGLNNYKLYPENFDITKIIEQSGDKDYYYGIYTYEERHYEHWKKVKSLSGIRDVKTNKLVIDFDYENDLIVAKKSALEAVSRLITKGFNRDDVQIYFSGGKGFHLEVNLDEWLTRPQFENIVWGVADGIKGFDESVKDQQRLIRMPFTKNQDTGLYKIPLTLEELEENPIDVIQSKARELQEEQWELYCEWKNKSVPLPKGLKDLKDKTVEKQTKEKSEITFEDRLDLTQKPKWMSPTKFALQEGFFKEGERNTAFMILAATYRANGFPRELAWRMLKGVAELQARRTNSKEYSEDALWTEVISVVYSPNWRGGTYAEKETDLLQVTADRFNLELDKTKDSLVSIEFVADRFKVFAENIDKNTIKTGIKEIDDNVLLTTGMAVGILGAPGSGKTSFSNSFIQHLSSQNQHSLFESLDMSDNLLFARLLQKYVRYDFKTILHKINTGDYDKHLMEAFEKVQMEFKNVGFNFRSGTTVEDIENDIIAKKKQIGDGLKLVVVDYLEKVRGPYSDPNANTGFVASRLTDLAREYDLCLFLLLQPQKSAGDPREELLSMRKVKGASIIEQDLRAIMTMWRPGFNPQDMSRDKYASVAVVKNNMGPLCQMDFRWDGLSGTIRSLTSEERGDLKMLREDLEAQKKEENQWGKISL